MSAYVVRLCLTIPFPQNYIGGVINLGSEYHLWQVIAQVGKEGFVFVMPCDMLYDNTIYFNVDVELRVPLDRH